MGWSFQDPRAACLESLHETGRQKQEGSYELNFQRIQMTKFLELWEDVYSSVQGSFCCPSTQPDGEEKLLS